MLALLSTIAIAAWAQDAEVRATLHSATQVQAEVSEDAAGEASETRGAKKPAPLNASVWFGPHDVPARNLNDPAIEPVRFRLDVGPDGRVANCVILDSSGFADVDAGICRTARERARFAPARNAKGEAIDGYYVARIDWNRNQDPVTATFTAVYEFTLHKDGTTSDCEVMGLFGPVPPTLMNSNPCTRPRSFAPVLDDQGEPVERRIRSVYSMEVLDPVK